MFKELSVSSTKREELIDITGIIKDQVSRLDVDEGSCILYTPHTTAGILINENYDPSVKSDILNRLSEIAPVNTGYSHSEGNADSHIKASLIGNSVNLLMKSGKIILGQWEGIFFAEFDGPRDRKVYMMVR